MSQKTDITEYVTETYVTENVYYRALYQHSRKLMLQTNVIPQPCIAENVYYKIWYRNLPYRRLASVGCILAERHSGLFRDQNWGFERALPTCCWPVTMLLGGDQLLLTSDLGLSMGTENTFNFEKLRSMLENLRNRIQCLRSRIQRLYSRIQCLYIKIQCPSTRVQCPCSIIQCLRRRLHCLCGRIQAHLCRKIPAVQVLEIGSQL